MSYAACLPAVKVQFKASGKLKATRTIK